MIRLRELYFIRHAESELNTQGKFSGLLDCDITEKGKEQINALKNYIKPENIDVTYTSPLKRAYQTALAVSDNPIIVNDLHEMNFGDIDGEQILKVKELYPDIFEKLGNPELDFRFPNGESKSDISNRTRAVIKDILNKNDCQKIAIVCHTIVIMSCISDILTNSASLLWRLEFANCSVTKVKLFDDKAVLSYLNRTAQ